LRETAHALAPNTKHGPEFVGVLIGVYIRHSAVGRTAAQLVEAARSSPYRLRVDERWIEGAPKHEAPGTLEEGPAEGAQQCAPPPWLELMSPPACVACRRAYTARSPGRLERLCLFGSLFPFERKLFVEIERLTRIDHVAAGISLATAAGNGSHAIEYLEHLMRW
jgi:hypothetical protein